MTKIPNLTFTLGIIAALSFSTSASELWISDTREECKSYYDGDENRQGYINASYNFLMRSEILKYLNKDVFIEKRVYKVYIEVNAEIDHAAFLVEVDNGDGYK